MILDNIYNLLDAEQADRNDIYDTLWRRSS